MAHPISRICSAFILITFFCSLAPLSLLQKNSDHELGRLISQVQQLQEAPNEGSTQFRVVFSHTITTLKSTAELIRVLCPAEQSRDTEKEQLVVSIKLPYLLPASPQLGNFALLGQLFPVSWQQIYISHISSPEIVPPIISC